MKLKDKILNAFGVLFVIAAIVSLWARVYFLMKDKQGVSIGTTGFAGTNVDAGVYVEPYTSILIAVVITVVGVGSLYKSWKEKNDLK